MSGGCCQLIVLGIDPTILWSSLVIWNFVNPLLAFRLVIVFFSIVDYGAFIIFQKVDKILIGFHPLSFRSHEAEGLVERPFMLFHQICAHNGRRPRNPGMAVHKDIPS